MEIPRSDKITKQKVSTPHAADDMPLWDGHFLIVGKCSEGKVRNVKKYFIHAPAWNGGPFQDLPGGAILRATPHNSRLTAQAPLRRLRHGICGAKMLDKTSSIICAFGLASAAPRSPYRQLELCGIALNTILLIIGDCTMVRKRICTKQEKRLLLLEIKVMYNKASIYLW